MADKDTATREYKVISTLKLDGKTYEPGKTVRLTAEQAAPLIGSSVEDPADKAEKK
jgi:hypothetical protein